MTGPKAKLLSELVVSDALDECKHVDFDEQERHFLGFVVESCNIVLQRPIRGLPNAHKLCGHNWALTLVAKPCFERVRKLLEAQDRAMSEGGKPHFSLLIQRSRESPALETFGGNAEVHPKHQRRWFRRWRNIAQKVLDGTFFLMLELGVFCPGGQKEVYTEDYFVSQENPEDAPSNHLRGTEREPDLLMRFGRGGLADFLATLMMILIRGLQLILSTLQRLCEVGPCVSALFGLLEGDPYLTSGTKLLALCEA
ncbi:hypothetical protein ACLOJK_036505 [Asimina triloba]